MHINANCKFTEINNTYNLILQQLVTRVHFLRTEFTASKQEENTLLQVVNSFIPPSIKQTDQYTRPRRAITALAAIAVGTGKVLGEPHKNAACDALSIFNLCHTNEDLSRDVERILTTQRDIVETLQLVQTRNDKNFFLLGNERPKKVCRNRDSVGLRFQQMAFYLVKATRYLAATSLECHRVNFRHISLTQFLQNYI